MQSFKYKFSLILIFCLLILKFGVLNTEAVIGSCTASVSPTSITHQPIGSAVSLHTDDLTFSVNNTGGSAAVWVKFTAPSGNFTVNSSSSAGWTSENGTQTATFTTGSLGAGSSANFVVNVYPGTDEVAAAAWSVQISDDAGGANPATCSGDTSVAIFGSPTDVDAPSLSDLVVSDITSSSVKVTWTTNESSTSSIDYGTTTSYGSTKSDTSLTTSHSINIDGLSTNTTYYYNVKSTDGSGNIGESGNNAFSTAKEGTTGTTIIGTTKTVTKTETKIIKDVSGPLLSLATDFKKPYEKAPLISGKVSDSGGVVRIEYSLDNGRNWIPVDEIKGQYSGSVSFGFTPTNLDDGDYKIRVRAYDSAGNVGVSKVYTMVIDRLPPMVGTSLFSIGPLILEPNKNGSILALSNLSQKVTLSSVGGATFIDLLAGSQKFTLFKNIDSGLWSGAITFDKPGTFKLMARSVDGAGNTTERNLSSVVVLEQGKVINSGGQAIKDAAITLYYFEPDQGKFVIWNGKPYVQENPQKTKDDGGYELFAPVGKYYIRVSAPGYQTSISEIFNLDRNTPINTNFTLQGGTGIKLGSLEISLPSFFAPQVPVKFEYPAGLENSTLEDNLVGQEFADFSLKVDGGDVTNFDLRGKSSVITFLSSWSPYTFEQINYLNKTDFGKGVNSLVVFVQESDSTVAIFKKRGGYKPQMAADPDGALVTFLNLQVVPTHVFTDRKGVIQKVIMGVLGQEEMEDNLIN